MKTVFCVKLQKELEKLDFPPLPGELGKRIFENISKEAWDNWQTTQTMIINENRLNLLEASSRTYLRNQMVHYLFGE